MDQNKILLAVNRTWLERVFRMICYQNSEYGCDATSCIDCVLGHKVNDCIRPCSPEELNATALSQALEEMAALARREHHYCDEDSWYSCPLAPEGCSDSSQPEDKCNCGADAHNAKVDAIMVRIKEGMSDGQNN